MKKIDKYCLEITVIALLTVALASTLAMNISAEDNTCPACSERPTPTSKVVIKNAIVASLAPEYCPSFGGESHEYEYISSVRYTKNPGGTMTITVEIYIANPTGCSYGNPCPEYDSSPEYINAWIDWNGDKTWNSNERVMDEALTGYININYQGTMTASKIITIPADAVNSTWMRVNLGWGYDPNDPCEYSWTWGNVIDKEIMVRPELEILGGLAQYEDELKDLVFRRNEDKPRFKVDAILQEGEKVKVDIFRGGPTPIKTLDTIKKSENVYEAIWDDWRSNEWTNIPDEIPVGKYEVKAKITKGGSELTSSDKKEFYVIFDYNLGNGFVESKNAFAKSLDSVLGNIISQTYPIDQYNTQKFKTAINIVDGQTQVRQASTLISTYTNNHPGGTVGVNWWCRDFSWQMIEYCRAVGIPARFLWAVGEWNDGAGIPKYKNKSTFNHAFVEVNNKNDGWIHYEPTGWGDDNQFGSDEYPKLGVEFRPDVWGLGYWVSAATGISSTGITGTENVYNRYTFCSDATSITFLNPPYDYGQTMQFSVTVKNNGAIPINTSLYVRLFDVPTILSLGPAHEIADVIIANTLNSGETATKQFSWILPDFGMLNSFYEAIGDRDVKVVVYYKASRADNVEIETDILSARVPGLCISPIQSITVDGEERSITNATFTHLNQTTEKSWRKEIYIPDIPSIVTIYTETEECEKYSKAIVSIENPDSGEHNYSFLVQLAGEGDAVYVPSLGNVTTNLTGLNVSTDYFVTYLQANGTNHNVSIYCFSKNATIECIKLLEYEGIPGVFVNVTWDQTLYPGTLQDFLIYFSNKNCNGLNFSEIYRTIAEEIVVNGDSLVNVEIVTPAQCKIGDIQPINITLFNNGVKNETITITLNITKIMSNIPDTTLALYNDTATMTVPPQIEEIVTFMVPVFEYTKSGPWDISVTNDKGIRAKAIFFVQDAFDLNCTQNITVEQHSEFTFNVSIANIWDTSVHTVKASVELGNYFKTTDPIELLIGDLLPNENVTYTWQLNATSTGLLPIEVQVTSDDGGYDIVGTTVTSLSQPSLWVPNVIKTTMPPDVGTNKTVLINFTIYNVGDLNAHNVSVEMFPPENVSTTNATWYIDNLIGRENITYFTNITFTKTENFIIDILACDDTGHNASGVIYVFIVSNLSASFDDVYSDYVLDTNADGKYNYLMIEVGVNVTSAGIGDIMGWLYDLNGTKIARSENASFLSIGNHSRILKFEGFDIYKHGKNGPYDLRDLNLYNDTGAQIDNRYYAYTTSAYNYTDFQHLVALTGNYSDYGTDTDCNGFFDNLTVNIEVILASEGHCVMSARLIDKSGEEIVLASNTSWLVANKSQIIQLNFDGKSINKHGIDGPYYLKDVYVYHTGDPTQPDYVCDAYTTNIYSYKDFETSHSLTVAVLSPENKTYPSTYVNLKYSVDPPGVALNWTQYSLDGGEPVNVTGNTTIQSLCGGNHSIVMQACDIYGNIAVSNIVNFTIHAADITGDNIVNVFDLQQLAWAFMSHPSDSNWNENADLNCDGVVNVFDLQILAWNFMNSY